MKKKDKAPAGKNTMGSSAFDGEFNDDLLSFLAESPSPFHACRAMARRLEAAGFRPLREADAWKVKEGDKAFVIRGDSSILAFRMGSSPVEHGFRLAGAHTDSPCLKPKPNPEMESCGLVKIGVEVYGGVLLSTWFDRDLSLAGRVTYLAEDGRLRNALVDFERAVAVLPNLAIHLNREVNENRSINRQWEMPPLMCHSGNDFKLRDQLTHRLREQGVTDVARVLDYDLCFYDVQPAAIIGIQGDFVSSARLDNLLSCYAGLQAILEAKGDATSVIVCNDHEEVGSVSSTGAEGPFLRSVLERLSGGGEALTRAIDRSLFVSTDNAHAVHPNYAEKHDSKHAPFLNRGPALKVNVNQRYATNGETGAIFSYVCERANVPLQKFVSRGDMPCGSTIGPLTAKVLGIRTVDVGVPTFAMHSARELAGTKDAPALSRALVELFSAPRLWE